MRCLVCLDIICKCPQASEPWTMACQRPPYVLCMYKLKKWSKVKILAKGLLMGSEPDSLGITSASRLCFTSSGGNPGKSGKWGNPLGCLSWKNICTNQFLPGNSIYSYSEFYVTFFCVFSRTLIFTQVSALKFHKLAKFHSKNLVLGMPAPYTTIIINIIQKDVDPPTHFRWDLLALKVLLGQSHVAKTFGKRHLGNLSKTT